MMKELWFISIEVAGHPGDGDPYEAKWLDSNGRMASRKIIILVTRLTWVVAAFSALRAFTMTSKLDSGKALCSLYG